MLFIFIIIVCCKVNMLCYSFNCYFLTATLHKRTSGKIIYIVMYIYIYIVYDTFAHINYTELLCTNTLVNTHLITTFYESLQQTNKHTHLPSVSAVTWQVQLAAHQCGSPSETSRCTQQQRNIEEPKEEEEEEELELTKNTIALLNGM